MRKLVFYTKIVDYLAYDFEIDLFSLATNYTNYHEKKIRANSCNSWQNKTDDLSKIRLHNYHYLICAACFVYYRRLFNPAFYPIP
jgi:hypothetical protein